MREIWKAVPGWDDFYEVSSRGNVRSKDRVVMKRGSPGSGVSASHYEGRQLKPFVTGKGYASVKLSKQGVRPVTMYVHDLVLTTFLGPRPVGLEACHNDGNPWNSVLENLRYDTRSANSRDSVKHGRCHLKNNPGLRWRKA